MTSDRVNRFLRPLVHEYPRKRIIAADLETDGLGGSFVAGGYMREGDSDLHTFTSPESWLHDHILARCNRSAVWYAHNGGAYDYQYLLPELLNLAEAGATVDLFVQGQSRVVGFKIKHKGKVYELRDSYAILPSRLADLGTQFAPELPKLDIGLDLGTHFDPDRAEHRAYMRRDVELLLTVLQRFDSLLWTHYGVHMAITASSTALRAWRRTIDRHYIRARPEVETIARAGYYGGLTYLRSIRKEQDVIALDINAAYPAAARQGVPYGPGQLTSRLHPRRPGFYNIRVKAPRNVPMAVLAKRRDNGGITWATGNFRTVASTIEIAQAAELGYSITVEDGVVFDELIYPFGQFFNYCESLELAHRGTPIAAAVKILRNGLLGKFGARSQVTDYTLSRTRPTIEHYPVIAWPDGGHPEPVPYLWAKDTDQDRSYMFPHWAAWTTAAARVNLIGLQQAIGFDHVIYCDTDSLHVARPVAERAIADRTIKIGPEYGRLKVAGEYAWFKANAPKDYDYESYSGDRGFKAKGIPARAITIEDRDRAMRGEHVTVAFDAMSSTIAVLTGAPRVASVERSLSDLGSSAAWTVENESVLPANLDE